MSLANLRVREMLPSALLMAVVAIVWLVYLPGLKGSFLFDDYATLPKLADYGDIRTAKDLERFVRGGIAGPAGRPLSLLSFLLDDDGWPSDAATFKRNNVLFHLLCAVLLCAVAIRTLRTLDWNPQRAAWAGVVAAAIWALHPLMASTTLYVVQRMTILSALFQLIGLLAHLHLRARLSEASPERCLPLLTVMAASLGLCTLAAFLSKENGALLPALVLVLEATVLRPAPAALSGLWRAWKWLVLGAPTLFVASYIVYTASLFGPEGALFRGFTLGERLLTEGRVLVAYLTSLAMPRLESGGLYHDDFAISTSLLSPWTTAPCIALIVALLVVAWKQRRRGALWACAILFFFVGHALESTAIPLEIYFEHRNYLPSVFLAVALSSSILSLRPGASAIIVTLLITVLGMLTAQRARLWGDTDLMLLFWADRQPGSERAQLEAAQVELRHGNLTAAIDRLDVAIARHPRSVALLSVRLGARCAIRQDRPSDVESLVSALGTAPYGPNTLRALELLIDTPSLRQCAAMKPDDRRRFATALRDNPSLGASPRPRQQSRFLLGLAELRAGNADAALAAFDDALRAGYEFEPAMRMVAELASCGFYGHAETLLHEVERRESSGNASSAENSAEISLMAATLGAEDRTQTPGCRP